MKSSKLNILISLSLFSLSLSFSQDNNSSFFKKKKNTESNSSSFKSKTFFKKKVNDNSIVSNHSEKDTINNETLKDSIISIVQNEIDTLDYDYNKNVEFLESPVDDGVITSGFSKSRFHPVLKKWKAHNGTDFAAPYGSPIKATAGGVVEIAAYSKGNGNYVKIKHNGTYSTQYLHMSKILVSEGDIIKLGQVIGLVGSSGLATGPHVCYRFWKNGVQVDPFNLDFSESENNENEILNTSAEEVENEKEFKSFVSGFFKKKS